MAEESAFTLPGLESDVTLTKQVKDFQDSLTEIERQIDLFTSQDTYDDLSVDDKIKHDLFATFSMCTLFWMYLSASNERDKLDLVKRELERVKEMHVKVKIIEEKHLRPRVNVPVAQRFIKSGLWENNAPKHTRFE